LIQTYLTLAVAVLTPLVTFFVTARRLSGKVATSEAKDLWVESRSIREDLNRRNEYLCSKLDDCETHIAKLEHRVLELERANSILEMENRRLKEKLNGTTRRT